MTFGAGGAFEFDIDDADGTPGTNWSMLGCLGDLDITATPDSPFVIDVDSLTGSVADGPLENFDPAKSFEWTFLEAGHH